MDIYTLPEYQELIQLNAHGDWNKSLALIEATRKSKLIEAADLDVLSFEEAKAYLGLENRHRAFAIFKGLSESDDLYCGLSALYLINVQFEFGLARQILKLRECYSKCLNVPDSEIVLLIESCIKTVVE